MKYFVSMNCCDFLYKRLYNNPEAGIHVPCWNYLHECSGVTGGGSAPLHFSLGNFMIYQEKRGKEERETERKRRKIWKGSEKLKMEGERYENEQRTSFLFVFVFCLFCLFVCLFFCLSLFETTEICLGSTKMDNFPGKNHISCLEKIRKPDFAPSEKYSS